MHAGSVVGFALVWVLVAWATSLAARGALRGAARGMRRHGPAAERHALELAVVAPVVIATAAVGLLVVWSIVGTDHCLEHGPHAHLCMVHGAPWATHPLALVIVVGAVLQTCVRAAGLAVAIVRRRRLVARLRTTSVARGDLRWIDTSSAICFVAGVRRPEIFVSTGAWTALEDDERDAMLAHERAHIRHRDIARGLALDALLAIGAPFASSVRARWDAVTERLCDARAAEAIGGGACVASAMVKVSRVNAWARPAASFRPRADALTDRVESVLAEPAPGDGVARALRAAVALGLGALVVVAALHVDWLHNALEDLLG